MLARRLRLLAVPISLTLSLTLPQFALAQFTPDIPIGQTNLNNAVVSVSSSTTIGSLATTRTVGPERSTPSDLPLAATGFQVSFWSAAVVLLATRRWFR